MSDVRTSPLGTAQSRRRAPSVLVVDDVYEVRRAHTRFFHGSEMEVFSAENGAQALDAVRRVMPDVVVTDVDMPVMDGLDLCRQLRSDAATRAVVIVMVTGDASEQAQAAKDAGCDAILPKPCSRTLLLATIRLLLERR